MTDNGNKREIRAGRMIPFDISIRLERRGGQADMSIASEKAKEKARTAVIISHIIVWQLIVCRQCV
jgi:hypothetical protein